MIERRTVLDALSGVRDPELDEPITDLEFVSGLEIEDEAVFVRLRLPTYFCAPNFSYLMVADTKEAVLSVPGVKSVRVVLEDHYASEEINAGVNEEQGFDNAFEGETDGPDLEELRTTFRRKSFVSRQEQLCRALLADGHSPADLAELVLGDAPVSAEFDTYLDRRAELGLDVGIRLRELNGRWLAVADFGGEPEVGIGATPRVALAAALGTLGERAAAVLMADPQLLGVSLEISRPA